MDAVASPEDVAATAARYERFATHEAPGRSELYRAWAAEIAARPELTALVATIPAAHRQPPLVFAVMRLLGAPERSGQAWTSWLVAHRRELVEECARRRVQTNEPLRCAALMPVLAGIREPIALIEVGASAGLCLYPDRYSYEYLTDDGATVRLDPPAGPSPVVLASRWRGRARPPERLPHVVWRAGLDLAPLDPASADTRAWLTGLVWPGETGRAERIERALEVAAADPPLLVAGEAASDAVTRLAARAPAGTTVVVATPGVLAYLSRDARAAVIARARAAGRWLTLDAAGTHDGWSSPPPEAGPGEFLLALDGEVVATADPLGRFVEWRDGGGSRAR